MKKVIILCLGILFLTQITHAATSLLYSHEINMAEKLFDRLDVANVTINQHCHKAQLILSSTVKSMSPAKWRVSYDDINLEPKTIKIDKKEIKVAIGLFDRLEVKPVKTGITLYSSVIIQARFCDNKLDNMKVIY